jgi:tetratricopeptide (TPR) repeat protein
LRRNKHAIASGKIKIAAQTANNIGVFLFQQKNLKASENYFQEAMQNYNGSNSPKMLALVTSRLGFVYDMDMDFDKALDLYKQSLKNFEQLHLEKQLAEVNYLISKLYIKINKADEASDYLKHGIEASEKASTNALGNKMTNLLQSIEQSKKERNTRLLQLLAVEKNGFQGMSNSQKGKVCKEIGYNYWGGSEFEKANNYFNKSATYYATAGEMPDNDEVLPDATQAIG